MPDFNLDPSPDFLDPRLTPEFQPAHYPLCNSLPAPDPATSDRHERRCLEFLAAYYAVNIAQARVAETQSPAERAVLHAALEALEAIEDRYAPIGFFGEPVMDGLSYRDLHFARPELPRIYQPASTLSSHIAIPGLEDIPLSELTGPVTTTRWTHGETHP